MDDVDRFTLAVKSANIERVLVIDDALGAPAFREEDAGDLLEILSDPGLAAKLDHRKIDSEMRTEVITALKSGDYRSDAVDEAWSKLYEAYLDRVVTKLDPGGRFKQTKGENADALRPILKLLEKCKPPLTITRIASLKDQVDFKTIKPQLVFLDYYLNDKIAPGPGDPDPKEGLIGIDASRELLEKIVADLPIEGPAVVLMSSYESVKDKAEAFRKSIDGGLFSSRFQFVQKGKLTIQSGKVIMAPEAAGVLLDLTQCRTFAVELNEALNNWKQGVAEAITQIGEDIGNLQLRDFAYLIRFRLREEGQPLSEYLEWFFGEVLLDRIGKKVNWNHPSFSALDKPVEGPGRLIEGMFDGATSQIAEMFSSVRVDAREIVGERDRRMGDLYMAAGAEKEIQAVITPECDLLTRNGGAPRAPRMLTVGGRLGPIGAPNVAVSDFIVRGGLPQSIEWDLKDVRSVAFGDQKKHPDGMVHVGTLRPLYAFELQRRVLDDLGRVGLAIAPALNYPTKAQVFERTSGKLTRLNLTTSDLANCSVMPGRGGSEGTRIVFHRSFVDQLLVELQKLPGNGDQEVAAWLERIKTVNWQDSVSRKFRAEGVTHGETFEKIAILARAKPAKINDEKAMCQVIVPPSGLEAS